MSYPLTWRRWGSIPGLQPATRDSTRDALASLFGSLHVLHLYVHRHFGLWPLLKSFEYGNWTERLQIYSQTRMWLCKARLHFLHGHWHQWRDAHTWENGLIFNLFFLSALYSWVLLSISKDKGMKRPKCWRCSRLIRVSLLSIWHLRKWGWLCGLLVQRSLVICTASICQF